MHYIVTGSAGFVGMHVCHRLLLAGHHVVGIDSLNDYYDPALKLARLATLAPSPRFDFVHGDIAEPSVLGALVGRVRPQVIIHLAAQAGVRYSIEAPEKYAQANLVGFLAVLEACRAYPPAHLVYASSSSVYGLRADPPFRESEPADFPVSFYAATKRANELMAHSYAHLFGLPCTGLRFFTAYGPWGRPDMAYFGFTERIFRGEEIPMYDGGSLERDFTYIDDIVEGVVRIAGQPPVRHGGVAPARVLNIGNSEAVRVSDFVDILERVIGRPAKRVVKPMQQGDVRITCADTTQLRELTGFVPNTSLSDGLRKFVAWYREYNRIAP